MSRRLATALLAVALGVVPAIAGYRQGRLKANAKVTSTEYHKLQQPLLANVLQEVQTRRTKGEPVYAMELFRYTTCPFSGKVKAFLDVHKLPYRTVEVEPIFKAEIKRHDYGKVPQLRVSSLVGQTLLVDSDAIVELLAPLVGVERMLSDPEINRWRGWARENLVRFLVLNINTSPVESWKAFDYIDRVDSVSLLHKWTLKITGAPVMFLVARLYTKPLLVKSGAYDGQSDVLECLKRELEGWVAALSGRAFHGGLQPDLADTDVYGVLQSVRSHRLYAQLQNSNWPQAAKLQAWLAEMDRAAGQK